MKTQSVTDWVEPFRSVYPAWSENIRRSKQVEEFAEWAWEGMKHAQTPSAKKEEYTFVPVNELNDAPLPAPGSLGRAPSQFIPLCECTAIEEVQSLILQSTRLQGVEALSLLTQTFSEDVFVLEVTHENTTVHAHMPGLDHDIRHAQTLVILVRSGITADIMLQEGLIEQGLFQQNIHILCEKESKAQIIHGSLHTPASSSGKRLDYYSIIQHQDSSLDLIFAETGARFVRTRVDAWLRGENAELRVNGVSALQNEQQHHRFLHIHHDAPNCESSQLFRQALKDKSRTSVDGTVKVGQHTSGTHSSQLINSLLLSPNARAAAKPNLIINHDDVECEHGNTCGELDAESLFFLQSRGFSEEEARLMLIDAFLREVTQIIRNKAWRMALQETVKSAFQGKQDV